MRILEHIEAIESGKNKVNTKAVVMTSPGELSLREVVLRDLAAGDVVAGISGKMVASAIFSASKFYFCL